MDSYFLEAVTNLSQSFSWRQINVGPMITIGGRGQDEAVKTWLG